jgi:hypothetical protein
MTEGIGTPGITPDPIVTTGGSGATAPTAGVGTTSTGGGQSTKDTAKDEARGVAQEGVEGGKHVAAVGADQAKQVAGEAGHQAKQLLGQAQSELVDHASSQQTRVADQLHSLASQLGSMASKSDEEGLAKDLAQQASHQVGSVAHWLSEREPGDLLGELKDFGRRKPGTFLAIAAGLGLLAGRMTRGVKEGTPDQGYSQGGYTQGSAVQGGYGGQTAAGTPVRQDVTTPVSSVTSPGATYEDRPGLVTPNPTAGEGGYVGDPVIGEPFPSDTPTTGTTR